MSGTSGYSNQKRKGQPQFASVQSLGSDKHGLLAPQMYLYELTPIAIAITVVALSQDQNSIILTIPAHGARKGDVLRFMTGNLLAWELEITSIVDANNLTVHNVVDTPVIVGNTVKTLRWTTALSDSSGALNVSSAPVRYLRDGIDTTVSEDTGTPANSRPFPVKLVGAAGDINITAGDLNISTDHANDSVRLGNGVNLTQVNASGELFVKDASAATATTAVQTAVTTMSAKLPATLGPKAKANAMAVTLATDEVLPLPTGASTLAEQQTQSTTLAAVKTSVELIDDAIGTDGVAKPSKVMVIGAVDGVGDTQELRSTTAGELLVSFGSAGFSTETTLSTLNNKVANNFGSVTGGVRTNAQVGNATGAADFNDGASGAQTLRTSANLKRNGNELSYNAGAPDANTLRVALATGSATEAKQDAEAILIGPVIETAPATDTASSGLNGRLQRIAQRITSLMALFPTSLGQKTMANSLAVVPPSDYVPPAPAVPTALTVKNGVRPVDVTANRLTTDGAAPSSTRRKLQFTIEVPASGSPNFYVGSSGVTNSAPTLGIQVFPGTLYTYDNDAGDYYIVSDTAGQIVYILEQE